MYDRFYGGGAFLVPLPIREQPQKCPSWIGLKQIIGQTDDDGEKNDVEIIIPLSNFWRTLEMTLINCEVNLILNCSANCVIMYANQGATFAITEANLHVQVVTLSAQDNAKLLTQ